MKTGSRPGQRGKLVVLTGPSGAGKSTITREVLRRTGAAFSVSATTRRPREGEADGRDYRFVDRAAFERMVQRGELLEWAEVFGNLYGTPAEPVRRAIADGETVVLEIDIQGGLQVHEKAPDAEFVLIVPPSEQELARRLRGRGSEDEKTIARRLAKAAAERKAAEQSGVYTHCVVNDNLADAVAQVVRIVEQESPDR